MKKTTLVLSLFLFFAIGAAQVSFNSVTISPSGTYNICVVDMNGDYLDDIVSVSTTNINIFFQNTGGGFTSQNFTTATADFLPSWSIAAGDLTGNGFNDLLYGGGNGVTFMIANATGTAYTEVSGPQYVFSQRSNFIDINNDGHLDAFVCHDVAPNVYYINDGTGGLTFNQGGIGDFPTGGNYGSLWVDYNNDGLMDNFIAKCGGSVERRTNQLFKNNGDGTYTDVALAAGMADPMQTWSAAWGDFNNDGYMDAFVGASSLSDGWHKLMKNNGDETFTDVTAGSGFHTFNGTSNEHATYDFNNDGFLDIFGNSNSIFINNGNMTFTQVAVPFSGAAIGDLNNDGFLDAFRGTTIYYNTGNNNNWIKVITKGVQSNKNGIGARVELESALGTQIRDVRSGEGFRYMSTLNTHFGIGQDTQITKITIRWPSGIIDEVLNPQINSALTVIEGSTVLGQQDLGFQNIAVYPNPVNDILQIRTPGNTAGIDVTIFDLSGRMVLKGFFDGNNGLNVSALSSGMYILQAKQGDYFKSTKFIKM